VVRRGLGVVCLCATSGEGTHEREELHGASRFT
jgi:hypothetical protein